MLSVTGQQRQLKNAGITTLMSYFNNSADANRFRTKILNISGKTGQYFVPDTLFQKRTSRENRMLIPFSHIIESNLTFDQLNSFEGGVAVEFTNRDFFSELELPDSTQHKIFRQLSDKLGSDDNVSSIIVIRSTGESSSKVQQYSLRELETFLKDKGIRTEEALLKRKKNVQYSGKGNDCWEGFAYYNVRGGQQEGADSHDTYGIPPNNVQLFNPSVEAANKTVANDITLTLLFFAFFAVPSSKRDSKWRKVVTNYSSYLETREYDNTTLLDYASKHISMNLEKGYLTDPIQVRRIVLQDFAAPMGDDALDITHQSAVNKHSYVWDDKNKTILTPARPTNLFWSKHLSNMMQQNFSLKEYIEHQVEIMSKWEKFGISNIGE